MIKVLIVEDSRVVLEHLEFIFSQDEEIKIIGTASNGSEAVEKVRILRPDVVTMDIHMPHMDGFKATRLIMETNPVPIVILSASWDPQEMDKTFLAMEAGAVAAMHKPAGLDDPRHDELVREIIRTVKTMADVKVVRRWSHRRIPAKIIPKDFFPGRFEYHQPRVVAIGASTGGPPVLHEILGGLPFDFPVPILIVQHISSGFAVGLAAWLNSVTELNVKIPMNGEKALPGNVYLAPDGVHMGISPAGTLYLSQSEPENFLRPSVSFLFRSIVDSYGPNSIGILLSGMGTDGANEMNYLKSRGGITIAQDEESSVIHGMPGEAIRMDAASLVLSPAEITQTLLDLARKEPIIQKITLSN